VFKILLLKGKVGVCQWRIYGTLLQKIILYNINKTAQFEVKYRCKSRTFAVVTLVFLIVIKCVKY